jgi:hypothetical protein
MTTTHCLERRKEFEAAQAVAVGKRNVVSKSGTQVWRIVMN